MMENRTFEQVQGMGEEIGFFRLNLPPDFVSYQRGNGEGIYAVCEKADKLLLNANESGHQFTAWAANNSVYFPHIKCGTPVLAEMRGMKRPIAVWDDLQNTKDAPENKERILDDLLPRPDDDPHSSDEHDW